MSGLDILVFVVMGVLLSVGLYVAMRLGALPGQIAERRGHPQADAIRVAGWLGLLTMGLLWPFALVWAFSRPPGASSADPALQEQVARLTERVHALEGRHDGRGEDSAQ